MSKEDKPLEYQRRIRDTKGVAQRLDLGYLRRPALLLLLRQRLTWALLAVAAAASVPIVLGIGGGRRLVENGPLSPAHAIFEKRCEVCHTQTFGGVPDKACQSCHDAGPHHAGKAQARCAECHLEHQGNVNLTAIGDANCTRCHAAGKPNITTFQDHSEFKRGQDLRPLKLNHAIHMPYQPRILRGMKLPMKCADCHVPGKPITFEASCKSCHARELEYDVYHLGIPPAPHKATREQIAKQFQGRPAKLLADSETYLFEKKCVYCHEGKIGEPFANINPTLPKSEFDHRRHRAIDCDSCHTQARTSTKTADVLLPQKNSCTPCHESTQCSTCHLFHNRTLEKDHARPLRELVPVAQASWPAPWGRPPGLPLPDQSPLLADRIIRNPVGQASWPVHASAARATSRPLRDEAGQRPALLASTRSNADPVGRASWPVQASAARPAFRSASAEAGQTRSNSRENAVAKAAPWGRPPGQPLLARSRP